MITSCSKSQQTTKYNSKIPFLVFYFCFLALSLSAQTDKDKPTVYIHQSSPSFKVRVLKFAARMFLSKNSIEKTLQESF